MCGAARQAVYGGELNLHLNGHKSGTSVHMVLSSALLTSIRSVLLDRVTRNCNRVEEAEATPPLLITRAFSSWTPLKYTT